jgi:hypothetical protein
MKESQHVEWKESWGRGIEKIRREWIRTLLADLKEKGEVTCQGKGPAARWRYLPVKGTLK